MDKMKSLLAAKELESALFSAVRVHDSMGIPYKTLLLAKLKTATPDVRLILENTVQLKNLERFIGIYLEEAIKYEYQTKNQRQFTY